MIDLLVIAGWAALLFGFVEGVVLTATRGFPLILAPYKMSPDALWVAPLVDLVLFVLVAGALAVMLPLLRRRRVPALRIVFGAFVLVGSFAVLDAPQLLHVASALLLSLGIAVAVARGLRGREERLVAWLRRHITAVPLGILLIAAVTVSYGLAKEALLARRLPVPTDSHANVLVLVLDTVRWDSVHRLAGSSLTPNIDRISAGGATFRNAWAASSWSLPSQATILTGRYPYAHGADWPSLSLSKDRPTLAEYFGSQGYAAGAFSGNSAWVVPEYLGRGFLRFRAYTFEDLLRRTTYGRIAARALWVVGLHPAGRGKKAQSVNAQFLDFLHDYPDRPFFAYLCYMDVNQAFHHPQFNRPVWEPEAGTGEIIAAYEQGLRRLDAEVGMIWAELERRGVLRNTVVIITSDHGESFGRHARGHQVVTGHGTGLYPEQTRVPLALIFPPLVPSGLRLDDVVSHRSLAVTATALAMDRAENPFGGTPLLPQSAATAPEAAALATLHYEERDMESVVWGRWQYIRSRREDGVGEELFDLVADPYAQTNVLAAPRQFPVPLATSRRLLVDLLHTDDHRNIPLWRLETPLVRANVGAPPFRSSRGSTAW